MKQSVSVCILVGIAALILENYIETSAPLAVFSRSRCVSSVINDDKGDDVIVPGTGTVVGKNPV